MYCHLEMRHLGRLGVGRLPWSFLPTAQARRNIVGLVRLLGPCMPASEPELPSMKNDVMHVPLR